MEKAILGPLTVVAGVILIGWAIFKINTTAGIIFTGIYLIACGYLYQKSNQ